MTTEQIHAKIARLWPAAKGSLAEVRKPCIRKGCRLCASGQRHPTVIFSYLSAGKRRCACVPRELAPALRRAIANGRRLEALLGECGAALVREHQAAKRARRNG